MHCEKNSFSSFLRPFLIKVFVESEVFFPLRVQVETVVKLGSPGGSRLCRCGVFRLDVEDSSFLLRNSPMAFVRSFPLSFLVGIARPLRLWSLARSDYCVCYKSGVEWVGSVGRRSVAIAPSWTFKGSDRVWRHKLPQRTRDCPLKQQSEFKLLHPFFVKSRIFCLSSLSFRMRCTRTKVLCVA